MVWNVVLLFGVSSSLESANDLSLAEVLDAWAAGCEAIWSYDLHISTTYSGYLDESQKDGAGKRISRILSKPRVEHTGSHQIRLRGKRRIEPGRGGVAVWDGELARTYNAAAKQLLIWDSIRSLGLETPDEDYETLYRTASGDSDRIETMRQRARTNLLPIENGLYVVETSASPGDNLSPFGWRVWLDSRRNFMPIRIVQFVEVDGKEAKVREWDNELGEVDPGCWAPIKSHVSSYWPGSISGIFGPMVAACEVKIDLDASKFNLPIEDDVFQIHAPPGTQVHDKVTGNNYVLGKNDAAQNLAQLAMQGRLGVTQLEGQGEAAPSPVVVLMNRNYTFWIMNSIGVLLVLLAILYRRYREKLSSD